MKRVGSVFLTIIMMFSFFSVEGFALDEEIIIWSEPKSAVYENLHPYTLNWSGNVLDRGGFVLSTLGVTNSPSEADFVINQYGAIGASGILKLGNESLDTETKTSVSGFVNSLTMEKGATYLIILHDGTFAKIRIDRFLPEQGISVTKVFFTYVTEMERVKVTQGSAQQPGTGAGAGAGVPVVGSPGADSGVPGTGGGVPSAGVGMPGAGSSGTGTGAVIDYPPDFEFEFPFSIYLIINSQYATIYDKNNQKTEYRLHTVPFIYEGRTMVPLRFVAEALGAEVEWRAEDSAVLIDYYGIKITLWIGRQLADVNGEGLALDVAPLIRDGYTMVPLRFISENMGMYVYYNSGMVLITDMENTTFESYDVGDLEGEEPESETGAEALYGVWSLWVPGGMMGPVYVPGAAAGWIEIRADGTYAWLDLGKVYEDMWSATGSDGHIIIHNGPMDSNWHMSLISEDEVKIYAWGLEYIGTWAE